MPSTTLSGRESLQFFGKISASVSHEIKNVFAVINEAAGLLEDFTIMVDKGMPIEQIGRASCRERVCPYV